MIRPGLLISAVFASLAAFGLTGTAHGDTPQLNQTGFTPHSQKLAIVPTEATAPLPWQLKDSGGHVVLAGTTTPFGLNSGSGKSVQQIDFSAYKVAGKDYVVSAGGSDSAPFDIEPDLYAPMAYDALAFFYHQRSGVPIEAKYVGEKWARPVAHEKEIVTCFGPKDYRGNDWGVCPYTLDVSKGWYDAADQGKYVVNGGIATWTLLNAYERSQVKHNRAFDDGKVRIPEAGNGVNDLLDEIRYEMDFLLSMQVPDGQTLRLPLGHQRDHMNALVFTSVDATGMVHHKMHDEHWTPVPTPPHLDKEKRGLTFPSTAATLNLAATGAYCARMFKGIDDAYADRCLKAAESAYAAAVRVPDAYAMDIVSGGGGGYGDGDVSDEFYWAAVELYLTTGEAAYEKAVKTSPHFLEMPTGNAKGQGDISWGSVQALGTMALATGRANPYQSQARKAVIATADAYLTPIDSQGYHIPFDRPYGWGSTADFNNRAMILAYAADLTGNVKYRHGVVDLTDYLLGRNPLSFSFVAGYGEHALSHPHHRFWANEGDLPPPPAGTISGGTNARPGDPAAISQLKGCLPQTCYLDEIASYSTNEVALNWNAPFFWVTSWLSETPEN
ncbi:MAG: glycoside hydrolase family 9 protein [Asticcacaulis sp.]